MLDIFCLKYTLFSYHSRNTTIFSIIETTLIHRRDVLSTSRWRCVFARYRVIKNTWVKSQQNRNQYKQLKKTGRLDTGYRYSKHENMNMNTRIKDLLFHTGNPSYWMQTLKQSWYRNYIKLITHMETFYLKHYGNKYCRIYLFIVNILFNLILIRLHFIS